MTQPNDITNGIHTITIADEPTTTTTVTNSTTSTSQPSTNTTPTRTSNLLTSKSLENLSTDYVYCSSDSENERTDVHDMHTDTHPSSLASSLIMEDHHNPATSSSSTTTTITTAAIVSQPQLTQLPIHQHQPSAFFSDDECSGEVDREYTGQFEGPEKTLEVCFRRKDGKDIAEINVPGQRAGLRTLSRADLDLICAKARCTILSSISNQYLDAYVLSESSLFVYNYMVVLKTCGTTTLLRCLSLLIELGRRLGLELDWMGYSRKNLNFPDDQQFPHGSFTQELDYLYSHRNLCEKLDGNGYTLGPITDDHWFVFVADQTIRSKVTDMEDNDRVLNIMMFDIDPDVGALFYYDQYPAKISQEESKEEAVKRISFAQTKAAGIDALCPGALFDPRAFEPCGYSMNAILFKSYCTMHITPEEGSSYASFETNQKLASYSSLVNNVVRTFKPKKFVMTLMADEGGLKEMKGDPLNSTSKASKIVVPMQSSKSPSPTSTTTSPAPSKNQHLIYKRTNLASIKVEEDCCCMMGNWTIEQDPRDEIYNSVRQERMRGMSFA